MEKVCLALIILIFTSCSENIVKKDCYYPVPNEVTMLTEDNMPTVETFSIEKIHLPTKYQNGNYYVYNDSIVVILNNSNPDPYIISIYNLNSKQEIAGYFKKGNGPNELLSVMGSFHNKNLLLQDGNLHAITQLNMDSVIEKQNDYVPTIIYHQADLMLSYVFVGNDTIVSANGMFIKKFDVDEVPEFELYNAKTGKALQNYHHNEKNFPPNAVYRTMTYSNSKFVVFWVKFPVISIYDKNFKIIKQYRDSKFEDCKLSLDGEFNNIVCKEYIDGYFSFGCKTRNYIIANNMRCNINKKEITDEFDTSKDLEIWVFDTDMNLRRRLKPEHDVKQAICNSYSENSNTFYINGYDEDGENALFKCVLK